jgi:hypothetical protein
LRAANNQKPNDALSGLQGGCGATSNPTLSITAEEAALLWGGLCHVEEASAFFLSTITTDS